MIRDGLAEPKPDAYGWLPIDELPLATGQWTLDPCTVTASPRIIEGVTTSGRFVTARYHATGDYSDRWVSLCGRFTYRLTHGRPLDD